MPYDYTNIEIKTIENKVFRYEVGSVFKLGNELTVHFLVEDERGKHDMMVMFNFDNVIAISYREN